jgi:two-component system, NarL family, response regulator
MNRLDKRATRILIVDDHPVIQAGLISMLATHPEVKVMGSAYSGEEALARMDEDMPDIVLLDLRMPGITGIDVLNAMHEKKASARAIVLTSFETDENIYRAIQAGAQGYLLKDTTQGEMLQAIAAVQAGRKHITGQVAARLAERMMRSSLSARELEILSMLAKGLTNKQVGNALAISENTVRNHVNSIFEKLEVADRTEAVTVAIQQGIIQVES